MKTGLATAAAALTLLLLIPAGAPAKRIAGVDVKPGCDFTDPAVCQFPWPNDLFTKRDKGTRHGPASRAQEVRHAAEQGRQADRPHGHEPRRRVQPRHAMLTKVPGLDTPAAVKRSKLPPLTNLKRGLAKSSPVVLINARTGKRHPIWAEIDSNAEKQDGPRADHPPGAQPRRGRALHRRAAQPPERERQGDQAQPRLPHLPRPHQDRRRARSSAVARTSSEIFKALKKAGVKRGSLYLAWDFTVASERSLTGRMLHIRDDAFGTLGDTNLRDLKVAGQLADRSVDTVTDYTPAQDDRIARKVEGHDHGAVLPDERRARPEAASASTSRGCRGGWARAFPFVCNIPRSALDPASPPKARPSLYGHGLLGRASEIDAGNVKSMSNEHNFVFCATRLGRVRQGGHAAHRLGAQGLLRLQHRRRPDAAGLPQHAVPRAGDDPPGGLSSQAAFQKNGQSVLDTTRLFFDGNSQGGIMGGALTAVAPDFDRAVLGVPGMNYSTLLQRSVDFDTYAAIIYPSYPKVIDRQLWLSQIQLLWDRGEANGYAQHMTTDPLPNTPRHTVLMHVAFGDHQVSDTTAEVEARTIGARAYQPAVDPAARRGRASS